MCRNIKTLFNFDPPVTDEEVHAASLQFVRKISGFNKPSKANEALFLAAIEATEEAVYNSLFKATTMTGNGHTIEALPIEKTVEILKAHAVIK